MDPRFRRGNLVSIVKYISDREQVSNSEIAGDLHMSMPTVLQHIKTLQTKGIVEETGKHRSSGGRRASLFTLKKDLAYAVGLDIKRDRQIFIIADMLGKTVYSCTCEVPYEDSFAYFEKIRRNLDAALTASGLQRGKGVGKNIFERFPCLQPSLQDPRLGLQFGVRHRRIFRRELLHLLRSFIKLFQASAAVAAHEIANQTHCRCSVCLPGKNSRVRHCFLTFPFYYYFCKMSKRLLPIF